VTGTRWSYQPRKHLALEWAGRELLTYQFRPDAEGKPFVHPLCTSQGVLLTAYRPWDHPWHRGLWFAWKYLNGVNFWEENAELEHAGRTVQIGSEQVTLEPEGARVSTTLGYVLASGDELVREWRELFISLPRASGDYTLEWTQSFEAQHGDVSVDRTPVAADTPWGGYAGLGWRAARSLGDFQLLDSEGRRDDLILGQRAQWVALSGVSDGAPGRAAGMTLFDHPDNPRHPTSWHMVRQPGFGYVNASLVFHEPFTLKQGERLTLCYCALIHDGWPDANLLNTEFERFAGQV